MLRTDLADSAETHFVLSNSPPTRAQKQLALAVLFGTLLVVIVVSGPLSHLRTSPVPAVLPIYVTTMIATDSITAIILFAQFSILQSRAVLVIATGYAYTAFILIPYLLSFPGLFGTAGLLGGPLSTAWFFLLWRVGFPIFVISYAMLKDADDATPLRRGALRPTIALSVGLVAAFVILATLLCLWGDLHLPNPLLAKLASSPLYPYYVGVPVLAASLLALVIVWFRRTSMLDLWLMVVMCLFAMEVPLSFWQNPTRFSFSWYTFRGIGILASSLILVVLLYEIATLYARLLRAINAQRREREARLITGDAVAASIAHEVRQPLSAMVTTADAGFRFLDRTEPNLERARQAFTQISADGHRAGALVANIRANFKSDSKDTTAFDLFDLIQETLAVADGELQRHLINVLAEPNLQVSAVRGNRVQVQQVLLNLIVNAIDAMASQNGPRVVSLRSEPYEGDRVLVSVADTGVGIESPDPHRIFNPLYTTKSDGMGMGLSICRAIVEAHNGQLWFTGNSPQGTIFQFTLPASASVSLTS